MRERLGSAVQTLPKKKSLWGRLLFATCFYGLLVFHDPLPLPKMGNHDGNHDIETPANKPENKPASQSTTNAKTIMTTIKMIIHLFISLL